MHLHRFILKINFRTCNCILAHKFHIMQWTFWKQTGEIERIKTDLLIWIRLIFTIGGVSGLKYCRNLEELKYQILDSTQAISCFNNLMLSFFINVEDIESISCLKLSYATMRYLYITITGNKTLSYLVIKGYHKCHISLINDKKSLNFPHYSNFLYCMKIYPKRKLYIAIAK